jgi:tetratricopeptide (TPR) repeat protein
LPNSYRLLLERGDLRLSAGQYPGAESDYRRAGEIQPESDSPKIGLAVVHLEIHSYPQAEAELQQVLRSSPSNFMVHYLLGELYIREGQNAEAVKYLEQAAASGFAPAHNELGKLYLKSNDLSSATREFETAIKLDPDDTTPYYQLSILYRRTGEKEKAQMALDRVKSLNDAQRSLGPVRSVMQRMRKFQVEDAVRQ